MATPSYVGVGINATNVTIGAEFDESGVLLGDLSYDLQNDAVEFRDRYSGRIGYAVNHDAALVYSLTGCTVTDKDAGLNVLTFTAAVTLANADFFASSGSSHNGLDFADREIRLASVSGSQPQGGARTVDMTFERPIGFNIA
mgnify:FL=1